MVAPAFMALEERNYDEGCALGGSRFVLATLPEMDVQSTITKGARLAPGPPVIDRCCGALTRTARMTEIWRIACDALRAGRLPHPARCIWHMGVDRGLPCSTPSVSPRCRTSPPAGAAEHGSRRHGQHCPRPPCTAGAAHAPWVAPATGRHVRLVLDPRLPQRSSGETLAGGLCTR